jgi:FtsH-binding integral membrane protein
MLGFFRSILIYCGGKDMARESGGFFSTRAAKEARLVFNENAVQVSDRVYNAIIGAVLLWGFVINALMCTYLKDIFLQWNIIAVIIGYFICCFIGVTMVHKSNSAAVSFIGYNFIVLPIGVVLSIALTQYDPNLIQRAVVITAGVTAIMIILGTAYPRFFLSLGRTLFIALISVFIIELIMIFVFHTDSTAIDWIVVIIFCGYIGYDWSAANQYQKTVDNAVDSAADLYLDIINLFIRILRILGRRR